MRLMRLAGLKLQAAINGGVYLHRSDSACNENLWIDATNRFPEHGNGFAGFNLHAGFLHQFFQIEVRLESKAVAKRRIKFLDKAKERILALKMVEENEIAARLANALHFFHDRDGIRDGGNKIRGEDSVESGVGKFQAGGVHFHEPDVAKAQLFGAFAGFFEHSLGEIDPCKLDIARQQWQRKARANADFEKVGPGKEIQKFGPKFPPALKHLAEEDVVHTRVGVIHPLHIFHAHTCIATTDKVKVLRAFRSRRKP